MQVFITRNRLQRDKRAHHCENVGTKNVRVADSRQKVLLGQPYWC